MDILNNNSKKAFKTIMVALRVFSILLFMGSAMLTICVFILNVLHVRKSSLPFIDDLISSKETFLLTPSQGVISILSLVIVGYFLWIMSNLLKNMIQDSIFDEKNVLLLKRLSILAVILSFFTQYQSFEDFSINLVSLLFALSLYISSLILNRAIEIVKEQELTI